MGKHDSDRLAERVGSRSTNEKRERISEDFESEDLIMDSSSSMSGLAGGVTVPRRLEYRTGRGESLLLMSLIFAIYIEIKMNKFLLVQRENNPHITK